jgi:hypothetical protein
MSYSLRRRNNFQKLLYVNAGMSWGLDVHELRSSANVYRHIFQEFSSYCYNCFVTRVEIGRGLL